MTHEKKWRTSMVVFTVLAALSVLYFLGLTIYVGPTYWFNYFWLALAGAFVAFGKAVPRLAKLPSMAKTILKAVGILLLFLFLSVEMNIIINMNTVPEDGADYVVVLGAKVNGETPSKTFQRRINTAAEYLLENPETMAVVSGGQGKDEEISEALAAARELEEAGIEPERIMKEDKSTSTEENLKFSMDIIKKPDAQVVICSSDFHIYRAVWIAEKQGYKNVSGLPSSSLPGLLPQYCVREFFGVLNDWRK